MASTVSSTLQQMSLSFGVGTASLVAAQLIHGIHMALFALGGLTILSTLVFAKLQRDDGANVSRGSNRPAED